MKILLVSWSVLPSNGGSSVIVENLASNFTKDEMIVLGSEKLIQDNNNISRKKTGPEFHYFFSELYFLGRGYRYFTWFRKWRFKPLIKKIKAMIIKEKIDQVIAVYPNPFYCHAACIAAKELNIPFSPYFHNTYVENIAITDPKAKTIQKEIFDASQHIFVMSKGMQKFYEKKYQLDKFIPLVHTFNKYPNPAAATNQVKPASKDHYKLVAIGNFNESNLDATKRFINAIKNHPKFSLSLYTHVPKVLLKSRGIDVDAISYEGFVSPDEVHDVLQAYDICILTHGFTGGYGEIEYKTIFPTRTIPFLLSGKPIFSHSPAGSFLNDFLIENDCAELVDEPSEKAIIAGLEKIINNQEYQNKLIAASKKTAQQFYGPTVVKHLKEILAKTQKVNL